MKELRNKTIALLLAGLGMLAMGCGTEGTTATNLPTTTLAYDFRVISSSPSNGMTNITAQTNPVQLIFSEEVDAATATPNNIVAKKESAQGQVTLNLAPSDITVSGNMVQITLESGANLSEDTIYYIVLLPGLRSTNNNTLYNGDYPQGVQVSFDTGVGYGNSKSGPPLVQNIQRSSDGVLGCFSANITFNEDVSLYLIDIRLEASLAFNSGWSQIDARVYPKYQARQDVLIIEGFCNGLAGSFDAFQMFKVIVNDVVDLEGNNVDCSNGNCSKTFN